MANAEDFERGGASRGAFEVSIDDAAHAFLDPLVTGEQILAAASLRPADEYLIFQLLLDGQLEEVRLDESVDLREPGREKSANIVQTQRRLRVPESPQHLGSLTADVPSRRLAEMNIVHARPIVPTASRGTR